MAHKEEYGVEDPRITLLEGVYYIASGAVPGNDGTLKLYWGGANRVMCAGAALIDRLVDACLACSRPPG